jgi:hypothetical protein
MFHVRRHVFFGDPAAAASAFDRIHFSCFKLRFRRGASGGWHHGWGWFSRWRRHSRSWHGLDFLVGFALRFRLGFCLRFDLRLPGGLCGNWSRGGWNGFGSRCSNGSGLCIDRRNDLSTRYRRSVTLYNFCEHATGGRR